MLRGGQVALRAFGLRFSQIEEITVSQASVGIDLGDVSSAWKGWRLVGDKLIGPTPGVRISVHDARAVPLMLDKIEVQRQEIKALQEENANLKKLARMEEQPRPY
jgi:hypothetical protein